MWYLRGFPSHVPQKLFLRAFCLLHFFDFCETNFYRCFTTEQVYVNGYALFVFVDRLNHTNGIFPYATDNYDAVTYCKINNDILIANSKRLHFFLCQRNRFGSRTNKSCHASGISYNVPCIVVHYHVDQNISWK